MTRATDPRVIAVVLFAFAVLAVLAAAAWGGGPAMPGENCPPIC